jgi:hypothetical protein
MERNCERMIAGLQGLAIRATRSADANEAESEVAMWRASIFRGPALATGTGGAASRPLTDYLYFTRRRVRHFRAVGAAL